MSTPLPQKHQDSRQSGNILFIILLAVVLIGLLTAAIQSSNNSESANIDDETLMIRASDVQRYAGQLERGVRIIMENGNSEVDLRFAHPDAPSSYGTIGTSPTTQLFSPQGGAATYQDPPANINDGSKWEFYGGSAIPGVGTSAAELVAVLPNVTQQFCAKINDLNSQSAQPLDTGAGAATTSNAGDCVYMGAPGRFNDGSSANFYAAPNTMDLTSFAQDANTSTARPAPQACVQCDDGSYHFYHVLLAR